MEDGHVNTISDKLYKILAHYYKIEIQVVSRMMFDKRLAQV